MPKQSASFEYTDSELLAILREAYVAVLTKGQTYSFQSGGATQSYTRADADTLLKHINTLEQRISAASSGFHSLPVRLGRA
ncbi:hypothetical protein SH661x_000416 [Planctomicrobium sp. SH661]|uniref:hypothetical protein n=1 Tax=Planctomicrobium sp. SH661 TaxID=3448124 RepID=UPI003F5B65D8